MISRIVVKIDWKGPQVEERVQRAIPLAMDDTTAAAAIFAKGNHPGWKNRTGTAEGSIRAEPARREGGGWHAEFGSYGVDYFIWLEIGARGRSGDNTLRRAADAEFPRLPDRLRFHLGMRE